MDELKPDLQEVWEYLRRNPHLAISGALFLGGILGLVCGVPAITGALFAAGATMLGGWVTLINGQRSSAIEKKAREASAKRYLTPELKRLIDRLLFIHQRTLANYSSATMGHVPPSDIQADFIPHMPVLYPNAPQFHDLTGDDAVALVSFYDSLQGIDRLVNDWYDRPAQQKDNIFNVILYNVDQGLKNAQICVTRFEIDALYPARNEVVGGGIAADGARPFAKPQGSRSSYKTLQRDATGRTTSEGSSDCRCSPRSPKATCESGSPPLKREEHMDAGNNSAIISATAGISGVLLGGAITALKEWLTHRSKRKTETAYLAAIVVSHLDRFANGCLHVALDDGTAYGQPAGDNGEHEPTTAAPDFQPLDIDVEWKVLPQDLMYAILRVPDQREQIQNRIAGIAEFVATPPDRIEYFHARQRDYAELGLKVSELALRLRKYAGMSIEKTQPDEWSRDNELRNVIQRIDELEAAAARRSRKSTEI